jgi:hypothetical protein
MRTLALLLAFFLLTIPVYSRGRGSLSHSSRPSSRSHSTRVYTPKVSSHHRSGSPKCIGCTRDGHGRIKRSSHSKTEFKRANPCPATGRSSGPCPGYVIDHIKPLKRGGADDPSNMEWQTKEQAKAKDKIE